MRIKILSPGFTSPNGAAFLFPFVAWQEELRNEGYSISVVNSIHECRDANAILVDSKFHKNMWLGHVEEILSDFSVLKESSDSLIYVDTTDSTGSLQADVLPLVDAYWKSQLLRNKKQYMRRMYGNRLYTDFYHHDMGITDRMPEWSSPVVDETNLDKLKLSWNSGLADYSLLGPMRMHAYRLLPVRALIRFPENDFIRHSATSRNTVSCRFGSNYDRDSVAWQRKKITEILRSKMSTVKLSRRKYFSELRVSRSVVSPFGLGEITLKDFEVFLTGGLLLKPNMDHMETWPDLFRNKQTILTHQWDLEDFGDVLARATTDSNEVREIADYGQELYRSHISKKHGPGMFLEHISRLLR